MENAVSKDIKDLLTPYKLGKPVLTGSGIPNTFDYLAVDCPFVFCHQDKFYMMYVGFDGIGYQTGLAVSHDLVHWDTKGAILKREDNVGWDRIGAAGTWILKDTNSLWEEPTLLKYDGRYWMIYHSYPEEGYETGPAQIGLAWTKDEDLLEWHRLPEPIFSWKDGLEWERGGLYKGCLIRHEGSFYLFYNAKNAKEGNWLEQIGLASSPDLINWKRCDKNPLIKVSEGEWDSKFCADPYVVKDGERWLTFYYGFNNKHAQDGIAFSHDLFHWEKYHRPILTNGKEGELDSKYAHKPSMLYHDGVLYHFYCACRKYKDGDAVKSLWDEFRTITFASSKQINI